METREKGTYFTLGKAFGRRRQDLPKLHNNPTVTHCAIECIYSSSFQPTDIIQSSRRPLYILSPHSSFSVSCKTASLMPPSQNLTYLLLPDLGVSHQPASGYCRSTPSNRACFAASTPNLTLPDHYHFAATSFLRMLQRNLDTASQTPVKATCSF